MKQIYYIIFALLLLSACSNQDTDGRLLKITVASGISGVDSLLQVKWRIGRQEPSELLFYIACGGDLEYLTDTIIHKDPDGDFTVISVADYFQEHQLFYVVYDIHTNQLKQLSLIHI